MGMTDMRERSITTFLILFLASGCDQLIGADFDRGAALDAGDHAPSDAGDAPAPPPPDGSDGPHGVAGDACPAPGTDAHDGGDGGEPGDAGDVRAPGDTADGDVGEPGDAGDVRESDDAGDAGDGATADADDAGDVIGDGPQSDGGDGPEPSDATDGRAVEDARGRGEPNVPPTLYVAATTDDKGLWLYALPAGSINAITTNIPPPIDVLAQAGGTRLVDDVEIQSVGQEVFLLARIGSNAQLASVRGDTWTAWQPVAADVRAMALANVEGALWACLVGGNGRLRLMSRGNDGAWQDHGDVMNQATIPGGDAPASMRKVDCTGMGSNLEFFALDGLGHLWNATKTPLGWSPFRRDRETGDHAFVDVDGCNAAGDLHVLVSDTALQWHGSRTASGNWSGFSDLEWHTGDPMGAIVAAAQASVLTEVEWMQVNSLGEIWLSTRYRCCPGPYERLVGISPDGRAFVSVSATGVLPF
jgi:hypothetical protein